MELRRSLMSHERYWLHKELTQKKDWSHNDFLRYLHSISSHRFSGYLRFNQYPDSIQVGESFQNTFDYLRSKTESNHKEHYLVFGFSDGDFRNSLTFSQTSVGSSNEINNAIIRSHREYASRHGISRLVGNIHTHPHNKNEGKPKGVISEYFSVNDLYFAARKRCDDEERISIVVGPTYNIAVMRTRETSFHGLSPYINQIDFEQGYYKDRGLSKNISTIIVDFLKDEEPSLTQLYETAWEINRDIAEQYSLALYAGLTGQVLKRVNDR